MFAFVGFLESPPRFGRRDAAAAAAAARMVRSRGWKNDEILGSRNLRGLVDGRGGSLYFHRYHWLPGSKVGFQGWKIDFSTKPKTSA